VSVSVGRSSTVITMMPRILNYDIPGVSLRLEDIGLTLT